MTRMTEEQQLAAWVIAAQQLGREHGVSAASWACDGNTSAEHVRRVVEMMDNGDPEMDVYLPARPNLSGEWADSHTPQSLAAEIVGADWETHGYNAPDMIPAAIVEALADAYETGVDETFISECERVLRAAL